jgi:hypothetical protein
MSTYQKRQRGPKVASATRLASRFRQGITPLNRITARGRICTAPHLLDTLIGHGSDGGRTMGAKPSVPCRAVPDRTVISGESRSLTDPPHRRSPVRVPLAGSEHYEDMALQLAPEEPEAGPWRAVPLPVLVRSVTRRRPGSMGPGRPVVLAIEGRSNNGKTSLAVRIGEAVPGAVVIHTDDIAWEHSRFGWADLLTDGILVPLHRGESVSYRPPRWAERGREGSLNVPAGCPLLVIEGDGARRREIAHLIDALIWVQSDEREADRRRLARDRDPDAFDLANQAPGGTPPDHAAWMAEEIPFNAAQRTWERADVIVCGTPEFPAIRSPKSSLRRRQSADGQQECPNSGQCRRAISVPLTPVRSGMPRSLTGGPQASSRCRSSMITAICKQGVRGSSPLSSTRDNVNGPVLKQAPDHQC